MKRRTFNALSLAMIAAPSLSVAQSFPTKPVRFIVPYAAGGLPDSVARIVASKLTEKLGQSVVIDNKPGGNGMVSFKSALKPADAEAIRMYLIQRANEDKALGEK